MVFQCLGRPKVYDGQSGTELVASLPLGYEWTSKVLKRINVEYIVMKLRELIWRAKLLHGFYRPTEASLGRSL